jgi:hypothetical protein
VGVRLEYDTAFLLAKLTFQESRYHKNSINVGIDPVKKINYSLIDVKLFLVWDNPGEITHIHFQDSDYRTFNTNKKEAPASSGNHFHLSPF